jgi:hypothetical protein
MVKIPLHIGETLLGSIPLFDIRKNKTNGELISS